MNAAAKAAILNPALANQSLARPLSAIEVAFAAALEAAFSAGHHDAASVAAHLQTNGVGPPDGSAAPWTAGSLEAALKGLNASLDQAYAANGIGA